MIRERDVNGMMIRQAAEDLEIGVPIRAWRVQDGALVLSLAYGGEAVWQERTVAPLTDDGRRTAASLKDDGRPWRFVEKLRKKNLPALPDGDLNKLTKQQLQQILLAWGYQTQTVQPRKAEYVEALAWLRSGVKGCRGERVQG